ncbi:MAG: hypothetical protein GY801_08940 [bacterium]|nr:hypothetical protein [bacterium]
MITDRELRIEGMDALLKALGAVQAERFISLMLREPFDYTKWQRTLWQDKSIREISQAAMDYRESQQT